MTEHRLADILSCQLFERQNQNGQDAACKQNQITSERTIIVKLNNFGNNVDGVKRIKIKCKLPHIEQQSRDQK